MHPIEHLRHVARSDGADPATVAAEAAGALRRLDSTSLVVSCRQVLRRHPTNGALWWVCSHLLASAGGRTDGVRLITELEEDRTSSVLTSALPADGSILVTGWSSTLVEAVTRRGDVGVTVAGRGRDSDALARSLRRRDVAVCQIDMEESAAAARTADVVVVDADLATVTTAYAAIGTAVLVAVASMDDVAVWLVARRGTRLPQSYGSAVDSLVESAGTSLCDTFPTSACRLVIGPDGAAVPSPPSLGPECPSVAELIASLR